MNEWNVYFSLAKLLLLITWNAKFGSNIKMRKVDFLSQEKIIDCSRVLTNVNNEDINVLFDDFESMLLQKLSKYFEYI